MRINSDNNGLFTTGNISQKAEGSRSFFAGRPNSATKSTADRIENKRKQAQAQAMKLIGDVYSRDRKLDNSIAELEDKAAKLLEENGTIGDRIKKNDEEQKNLMAEYKIAPDRDEQKDLELLKKREDALKKGIRLTDEENARLAEIDRNGMTEYQSRSMELYSQQGDMRDRLDDNKKEAEGILSAVRDTETERLKSSDMIIAQKAADEITDAAGKEIIGMLIDEVRDSVDDRIKEEQEKAEKEQKTKENRNRTDEQKLVRDAEIYDAQKQVQKITDRMNLLDEDIKGAEVDAAL